MRARQLGASENSRTLLCRLYIKLEELRLSYRSVVTFWARGLRSRRWQKVGATYEHVHSFGWIECMGNEHE
jgi:hypothetical protein